MVAKIIARLLEQDEPLTPEPEDFDLKDVSDLSPVSAVNLSDEIWGNDDLLRKAFSWLTRQTLAPRFGNVPIGIYQQFQVDALNKLKALAERHGLSLKSVRMRHRNIQAWNSGTGKWVTFAVLINGNLIEDQASDDADFDLSDVAHPENTVTPQNPYWWKLGQRSDWNIVGLEDWIVKTEMNTEYSLTLRPFRRQTSSNAGYDVSEMVEIFLGIIDRARQSRIDEFNLTLFPELGEQEMREVLDLAEDQGQISYTVSGKFVRGRILNVPRGFKESEDDFDLKDISPDKIAVQSWSEDSAPVEFPGIDDCDMLYSVSSRTEDFTVYIMTQEDENGEWYFQCLVDGDTFVDSYGPITGPFDSSESAALSALNLALEWFLTNNLRFTLDNNLKRIVRRSKRKPKNQKPTLEDLVDPDDLDLKDVIFTDQDLVGTKVPGKKDYGTELQYGPYKLVWHDYPDRSRIISMYWKSRRNGWVHGSIQKLNHPYDWDKWLKATLRLFDRYSEGPLAANYTPSLPLQNGETYDPRRYLKKYGHVGESEDDFDLNWKDVSDTETDVLKPTRFQDVLIGTAFKTREGEIATKLDKDNILVNGVVSKLGNPFYRCYPLTWNSAVIKSYGRRSKRDDHMNKFWWAHHKKIGESTEGEADDTDIEDTLKEIGSESQHDCFGFYHSDDSPICKDCAVNYLCGHKTRQRKEPPLPLRGQRKRTVENLDESIADEDDEFLRDMAREPEPEEYELWQIKAAEPIFFSRRSARFHGTKKIYKYRGNYIVLHNKKRMGGHAFGVGDWTLDEYVIYQFVKTPDSPEGILLLKGRARELSDAKQMIKSGDFRSRRERLGLPESVDDPDFTLSDITNSSELIRETEFFRLMREDDDYFLYCIKEGYPKKVKVQPSDVYLLKTVAESEFNGIAIFEYGCGVFDSPQEIDTETFGESQEELKIRNLSPIEAEESGHDIGEIDETPILRMSMPGAYIDYEDNGHAVWILNVETEPKFRHQGKATYLMNALKKHAESHGKSVIHGSFTDDGEKYLKPLVKRLWPDDHSIDETIQLLTHVS